jgi:uncharacterized OB-fold protein
MNELPDWTLEQEGLVYQVCAACDTHWYFHRRFCPRCGNDVVRQLQASGRGTVYAVTAIHRAPTDTMRAYTPYTIVLVDAVEGFRMMAHGAADLRIGDAVHAEYHAIGGKLMPYFDKGQS